MEIKGDLRMIMRMAFYSCNNHRKINLERVAVIEEDAFVGTSISTPNL